MSANRINRVIATINNACKELETGIHEAEEGNTRSQEAIATLKTNCQAIVDRISGWFNKHIKRNEESIHLNQVAIRQATNLKANIEKMFQEDEKPQIPTDA